MTAITTEFDGGRISATRDDDGYGVYLAVDVNPGDTVVNHRSLPDGTTLPALSDREVVHRGSVALLRSDVVVRLDPDQARDLAAVLVHLADEADR